MVGTMDMIEWAHLFVFDRGIDQLEHVLHDNNRIKAGVGHDIQQFR